MKLIYRIILILSFLLIFIFTSISGYAQEIDGWSDPENLSNTKTKSHHQYIISDKYGYVHVFWVEDVGGPEVSETNTGPPGNSILYRRWDGERWSTLVDIVYSRGGSISYPTSAIDDDGTIYLVWNTPNGIRLSSAPAHSATSAKDWSQSIVIAPQVGAGSRVGFLARGSGELDLVYDTTNQMEFDNSDGNIYHIRSTDGGQNWSSPVKISNIERQSQSIAVFPRLIRDVNNKLHAVWYVADPPGFVGTAVYYSNSKDNGDNWKSPEKVDQVSESQNWATTINIGVTEPDQVHLVWVCGKLPGRCHKWSTDGGETWTPVQKLFGDLHSRANWDALATDDSGTLYWIIQLRYPPALYYSYWNGDHWLPIPNVVHNRDPIVSEGHGVQLTINLGNQLHLVVHHPDVFEVWHIWGVNPSGTAQEPIPTPTIIPTTTDALIPGDTPSARPTQQEFQNTPEIDTSQSSELDSPREGLLIGIVPVIFVLGGIIIYKLRTREFG